MDLARDILFGQIVRDRGLVAQATIQQAYAQTRSLQAQGHAVQLGQLLFREQLIDGSNYQNIEATINQYGRNCNQCQQAILLPPGSIEFCGRCRSPLQSLNAAQVQQQPAPFNSHSAFTSNFSGGLNYPPTTTPPPPQHSQFRSPGSGYNPVLPQSSGLIPAIQADQHAVLMSARHRMPVTGFTPPASTAASTPVDDSRDTGANSRGGQLKEGGTFANHEIMEELGRGGMGVVYKARNLENNEIVALKILLAGELASKKHKARFLEEINILEQLDHPGIIPIRNHGEEADMLYYTMEFVEGGALDRLIKDRKLKMRKGMELIAQVANAMFEAHEMDIVHRDIKPANIMVDGEGNGVVMDFGLAKDLEANHGMTRSGVPIGTPYYMPPEQARGDHKTIDGRADIYALGAVLYEIITGRVPFKANSTNELIRMIIEEEPVPPRRLNPRCSVEFEAITLQCLAKDREHRYDTALDLALDLEAALAGKPVKAGSGFFVNLKRTIKRNKKTVIALGIVVTIVLIIGLLIYERQQANIRAEIEKKRIQEEQNRQALLAEKRAAEEKLKRDKEKAIREKRLQQESLKRRKLEAEKQINLARTNIEQLIRNSQRQTTISPWKNTIQQAKRASEKLFSYDKTLITGKDHFQHGLILEYLGNYNEALENYRRAAKTPNFQARGHLAAGTLLWFNTHDQVQSLVHWRAAQVSNNVERSFENQELTAAKVSKAGIMLASPEKVQIQSLLDQVPNAPGVREAQMLEGYICLEASAGASKRRVEFLRRSLRVLRTALQTDPFNVFTVCLTGKAELRLLSLLTNKQAHAKQLKTVESLARRAERINAQHPDVQQFIAQIHALKGDYDQAKIALVKALKSAKSESVRANLIDEIKTIERHASVPKFRPRQEPPKPQRFDATQLVPETYQVSIESLDLKFDNKIRERVMPAARAFISHMKSAELPEAVKDLKMVLTISKNHFKAQVYLGFCYIQLGKFDLARSIFEKLRKEHPKHPWLMKFRALIEVVSDEPKEKRNLILAEQLLLAADKLLKEDFECASLLCQMYLQSENYAALLKYSDSILAVYRNYVGVTLQKTQALLGLKRYDEALTLSKAAWEKTRLKEAFILYVFSLAAAEKVTKEVADMIDIVAPRFRGGSPFLDLAMAVYFNRTNRKDQAKRILVNMVKKVRPTPLIFGIIDREIKLVD